MIQRKKLFATFVRFGMVGVLATALHYGLYYLLHFIMGANAAFTVGYLLGFVANFYLTSYFTFGTSPSWRKLFGMGGAHAVNYLLQKMCIRDSNLTVAYPQKNARPEEKSWHRTGG